MRLKNLLLISTLSAIVTAAAGSKFSWDVSSWQCNLASPGAEQVCKLQSVPSIWRGAKSGFILGGILGVAGCVFISRKQQSLQFQVAQPINEKVTATSNDVHWDYLSAGILIGAIAFAVSEPVKNQVVRRVAIATAKAPVSLEKLFENSRSIGNVAICAAEGNCSSDGSGTHTNLYLQGGHFDPANDVYNRGFCSDQGRGRDNADADNKCVERNKSRLNKITQLMTAAGTPPQQHIKAFISGIDQWNQASPRVSDKFPSKYSQALQQGMTEEAAIKWARVEAFRNWRGQLDASGLRTVCSSKWSLSTQQKAGLIGLSVGSEQYMKRCIGADQKRRTDAIAITLQNYGKSAGISPVENYRQSNIIQPTTTKPKNSNTQLSDIQSVNKDIVVEMRYATADNFMGKKVYPVAKCLLKPTVAKKLSAVQQDLAPLGLGLKVYDCYRPLSIQKLMWEIKPDEDYVANPATGSRHNRGAAVDLTLVDSTGKELEMPSAFDDFTKKAHRNYTGSSVTARQNSLLLEAAMKRRNFTSIAKEWWHFDSPDWKKFPVMDLPL
ncbi:peptidase M15D vanX D-ala-D-ala dipeptidase [Crinalium epipsammum PCC 9333]|uniref:D-alanyl-D-alanine dipeptidase n=1 Tax=Crinalium epipsammum PCC 9333 TaxID=1173022 RepID=K9VVL1_9CYAN|nr:M15 family metallopeptidase [Crinalium epipsammum]AFZ11522.1 peptidase M15D vanX D-ala-D-ala dipeptidase [Crinalium epipsammum PCC 9333]